MSPSFTTLRTGAYQAPLFMGFSRQKVGSHALLQGNLPNPGIEPRSPALAGRLFTAEPPGEPWSGVFRGFLPPPLPRPPQHLPWVAEVTRMAVTQRLQSAAARRAMVAARVCARLSVGCAGGPALHHRVGTVAWSTSLWGTGRVRRGTGAAEEEGRSPLFLQVPEGL